MRSSMFPSLDDNYCIISFISGDVAFFHSILSLRSSFLERKSMTNENFNLVSNATKDKLKQRVRFVPSLQTWNLMYLQLPMTFIFIFFLLSLIHKRQVLLLLIYQENIIPHFSFNYAFSLRRSFLRRSAVLLFSSL